MKEKKNNPHKVLLGVCGSIAAYKACELVHKLRYSSMEVKCVLTPSGQKFITPLTLQTLSNNPVYTEMFVSSGPSNYDIEHISLACWADLIVVAPATAATIARIANGLADELLASTIMASKAPVLICPAMNTNMWNHPANRENVKKLKSYGYEFAGPESGALACGTEGMGRLASVDVIFKKINSILSR
ncbi:MAG: hypothetical protein A2297_03490 [Elusimicrobia bacterium RIFOXYB2_FULL_48_7]|nr:MAG: hypothetical protein A2297_03490 [Elusimicrobia bacterium RIFOXYB2_FULL_48_7]